MNRRQSLQRDPAGGRLRQNRAAFFERRVNELQCCAGHLECWVNAQRQLIDGFFIAQSFQDLLLIFAGPLMPRMRWLRAGHGFRTLGKRANVRPKFGDIGRLEVSAMRTEHGMKAIRGGEDNLGYHFAALDHQRRRQQIFDIVREFAELPEPASGGVALERVHRPPDASQRVGVRRVGFQEDARLVQLL